MEDQPNNPLHGLTLKTVVEELVERYGFEGLGARINIRCFTHDPSVKSSLKFLRKTQWARDKVEALYIDMQGTLNQQQTIYGQKD
jgi:uncharacterized protein (DUF2132 family)